jgi:hypothetical protein
VLTSGPFFFVGRPVVTGRSVVNGRPVVAGRSFVTGRSDVDGTVKFDVSFGRTVKFTVLELPSPATWH